MVFHRFDPGLGAGAFLMMAACTQSGPSTDQTSSGVQDRADVPVTEINPDPEINKTPLEARLERGLASPIASPPSGLMNSPGPGTPSGPSIKGMIVADIPGEWQLHTLNGTQTVKLSLISEPNLAIGNVHLNSEWPFSGTAPDRWMFVSLGQLVLTGEDGTIAWRGDVTDAVTFSGTLTSENEKALLVRTNK